MNEYKRVIDAMANEPAMKGLMIPDEWKEDIDQRLVVDYMAANRYYSQNNPELKDAVVEAAEEDPETFYDNLVSAWTEHHNHFEQQLEPAIARYINLDFSELTPENVQMLLDQYKKTVEIDARTLIYSAAIKPHVDKHSQRLAEELGVTQEELISSQLVTATFFKYYTRRNLELLVDCPEGSYETNEKALDIAAEFHASDVDIMRSRLAILSEQYQAVGLERALKRFQGNVPEIEPIDGLAGAQVLALRRSIEFDNVEEYMIAHNLEGISGYLLRKIIIGYLADAKILPQGGGIYDFADETILEGLNTLKSYREEGFERKITPKTQYGLTCSAACATMVENYLLGTPLSDDVEAAYARATTSSFTPGQHYSLLGSEMADRGIDVHLEHSSPQFFDKGTLPGDLFDDLMSEYSAGLSQCHKKGVAVDTGVEITPSHIQEILNKSEIVILAGQLASSQIFHSVLVIGINSRDKFVVIDPMKGKKELWDSEKLAKFSRTTIGSWLMRIRDS